MDPYVRSTLRDEEKERAAFEEKAFLQKFLSTIQRNPKPNATGNSITSRGCPDKATFLKRKADGDYEDETLSAMWWAWKRAVGLGKTRS